jgi:hypothetical protein
MIKTHNRPRCIETSFTKRFAPSIMLPRLVFRTTFAVALLVAFIGGCSCSKQPREAWDSGLRRSERDEAQLGGASGGAAASERPADGSDDGGGAGSGEGSANGGGQGSGEGRDGGGNDAGQQGEGAGGSGQSGDSANRTAGGGGKAGGDSVAGNNDADDTGGVGNSSESAAALPGRPQPKPKYDAATAAAVAERHLQRATADRSAGKLEASYEAALEAFEAVEPHAAADNSCKQLLARAKRLLSDLAGSLNRENRPRSVPTYFE